jgi:RNA polymerase sigma-70 factor (ECF subfamily)
MGAAGAPPRPGIPGEVDVEADRELVLPAQSGDGAAFAELYSWYAARLTRYCRARLGSDTDAEDAAQEAFARAWRSLPRFGGERRFYA